MSEGLLPCSYQTWAFQPLSIFLQPPLGCLGVLALPIFLQPPRLAGRNHLSTRDFPSWGPDFGTSCSLFSFSFCSPFFLDSASARICLPQLGFPYPSAAPFGKSSPFPFRRHLSSIFIFGSSPCSQVFQIGLKHHLRPWFRQKSYLPVVSPKLGLLSSTSSGRLPIV